MRRTSRMPLRLALVLSSTTTFAACGLIASDPDAGVEVDATTDIVEAAAADATLDLASPDAVADAVVADATLVDAPDATTGDAAADVGQDSGVDAYFNASPDASGCTYFWDAGCTTIPKPVSISVGCVAAPPTPEGGTIAPGVYHLTHADWNEQYFDGGCPVNTTWGGNLEICGNVIEDYDVNDVHSVFVGNLVYQTSGDQLEMNQYCPSGPYFTSFGYTATPTQLTINFGTPPGLIETYTKQ